MSSNISVYRICGFCGFEFVAHKTTIKYCSLKCSSKDYKRRLKITKLKAQTFKQSKLKINHLLILMTSKNKYLELRSNFTTLFYYLLRDRVKL
jgi:hypothetical protein